MSLLGVTLRSASSRRIEGGPTMANGLAFGRIWRVETTNRQDREGRGIDAYTWAVRTCDAVRRDGQTPEATVRRVQRSKPGFTEAGAKVIVSAALRALCPDQKTLVLP